MAKTKTTTTVCYPVEEFIALLQKKIFDGKEIRVDFKIEEVDGDPLDRYPGRDAVTQISVSFDGPADSASI